MYPSSKVLFASFVACLAYSAGRNAAGPLALDGTPVNPFSGAARANVFLFVRTDCPVTNRYAPELARIAEKFSRDRVSFWMVYPDSSEQAAAIRNHMAQYHLPGTPLRDPEHQLATQSHATVAPEVAVFDADGHLQYHGRIDDRYIDVGKSRPQAQVHDLEDALHHVLAGTPVPHSETRAIGCSLADIQ